MKKKTKDLLVSVPPPVTTRNPNLPVIAFAYPYGNGFVPQWVESLTGLLLYEASKPKEERILGSALKAGSCYVDSNRNQLAIHFNNETQDDWLLMIDTDIQFEHIILERLAKLIMENPEAKIISGRVNLLNGLPVFYNLSEDGKQIHQPFPFKGLKKFDLIGTGIICIKREVFPVLSKVQGHHHYFHRIITQEGFSLGDDFSFCLRAKELLGLDLYGAWEVEGIHWKMQPCRSAYLELEQLKVR